jgi:glutamine amidotransferase-like uncharacterized protein
MKADWNRKHTILFTILGFLLTAHCQTSPASEVALYSDAGCWDESVQALERMFEWMGCTVKKVDADFINSGLGSCKILCVPGGDMYQYARDISAAGKTNIKDFIKAGGAYIGVCGGAYFAAEKVVWRGQQLSMTPLALFAGTAQGPIDEIIPYPDYGMSKIVILDTTHAITQSEPDSLWVLYYWGPVLIPDQGADISILGRYETYDQPAMLAFRYGGGRVFLIGTHPEIEEDSDRDGGNFAEELDDRGSDWDLMKRAVDWCLDK